MQTHVHPPTHTRTYSKLTHTSSLCSSPWRRSRRPQEGDQTPRTHALSLSLSLQVSTRKSAAAITEDVAQILDDEAQVFTMKLWRLIIYETEAARMGVA